MNSPFRILGIGALVGGGVALLLAVFIAAILIGPLIFWLAWNVLDFGPEIGLPELGFWSIVLATLFLIVGWFGKALITAILFLVDPGWLDGAAQVNWPDPGFRNFVAIALLAILASPRMPTPTSRRRGSRRRKRRRCRGATSPAPCARTARTDAEAGGDDQAWGTRIHATGVQFTPS